MINYEWDIETVDIESDDILDHDHRNKLSEYGMEELLHALNQDVEPGNTYTRLVLVRTLDDGGRSWAYVEEDHKLPKQFLDAYDNPVCDVPKRFIKEINL